MMIATVLSFVFALAIYSALRSEQRWNRCPICRQYHRGNVTLPSLPAEADGSIQTAMCKQCLEHADFFERREQQIQKEISR